MDRVRAAMEKLRSAGMDLTEATGAHPELETLLLLSARRADCEADALAWILSRRGEDASPG
jgi:hypothetical protein